MIEHHRRIIAYLEEIGASAIRLERRKNMHVHFEWQGRPRTFVTSATPSDRRAHLQALTDLRHALGLVDGERRVGKRRRHRRSAAAVPLAPPVLTVKPDWHDTLLEFELPLDIPPIPAHAVRVV